MFKENLQAFVTALYNVCNDQLTESFSQCSLIDSIEHSFVIYSDSVSTDLIKSSVVYICILILMYSKVQFLYHMLCQFLRIVCF